MVDKHMKNSRFSLGFPVAILCSLVTLPYATTPALGKDKTVSFSQMPAGENFYFGRKLIDIKAQDSAVPRVDEDTIGDYADLALADEFYVGQVNARGQLVYLETWVRMPETDVDLATTIQGTPLSAYSIARSGRDLATQKPRFFVMSEGQWTEVPVDETRGETRFLRLRMLAALEGDGADPYAEILTQAVSLKTYFTYDETGHLQQIIRQRRSTDFKDERVFPPL